jgi:molecular chaperone DnaK (HSP70)
MRLGIDLGTTRTIVAVGDRGNYPVVGFSRADGDLVEHYPTVSAAVDGKLVHGLDAEQAEREGAPSLRSWKRLLMTTTKDEPIAIGDVSITPIELVTQFLESLRRDLRERSNVARSLGDTFEAVISVPANAHSTQRFVTLDAFRRAGFAVRAVINEPSAAGIEYAHRHKNTLSSRREHVVVYDLGGGTFDSALVYLRDGRHDIETTAGIAQLGGDDFDAQLLAMALERAERAFPEDAAKRADLLKECREAKESIHPNSRKIALDLLGLGEEAPEAPIVIPVADYFERVRPLVEQTLVAIEPLVALLRDDEERGDIAGIYMVGGASGLPVVPRTVRERFGRRVHRSPHPAAATAIGCAIAACADEPAELGLSERFTRHFGVFREAERGQRAVFDGIFTKGTPMPAREGDPLVATRRYRAAHNVGHFRFVEAATIDETGDPTGDMTPHAEVLFPFASGLVQGTLSSVPIDRLGDDGPLIEERYEVDAAGVIAVTITNLDQGRGARFVL